MERKEITNLVRVRGGKKKREKNLYDVEETCRADSKSLVVLLKKHKRNECTATTGKRSTQS